ncbi:M81 family metallopeptidase [Herbaspirillum autotrophicum]|uniref:M81 family metallopeptidase n=1 Tax=Herbaspirillum autotrophicum TaxID=180195 RepID=UPI00067C7939|nr:M81 family metallopeptidase [Herbaspirillum autotrophicum]
MKIAIGALLFEGNTFSAGRSAFAQFKQNYYYEGEQILTRLGGGEVEISGALQVFHAANVELLPLIATHGGCGGAVLRDSFEELQRNLLARLHTEKVDGIYLALHGGMICEDTAHPEVELLTRLRALVGDIPVVVSYDLHAHVTPALLQLCDALVGYQHYPHDDPFETGVRGAQLLLKALQPASAVTMSMKKLAMLISPTTSGTRTDTPMRDIYKQCRAFEALPGILSVSYFPLTPWAEHEDGGTAFVVVSDGPNEHTEKILTTLCDRLWRDRHRLTPQLVTLDEALSDSRDLQEGPVILSEMSDAVGAGATGDSAVVLDACLRTGNNASLLVQIVDPEVVAQARERGIGSVAHYAVGHKVETRNGPPVSLEAEVLSLHDGAFTYAGGLMSGIRSTVGDAVILRHRHVTLFVTSKAAYEYGDEQYVAAGLTLSDYKYVVVKNPMNYRQTYAWAPRLYALDTPGAARADLTKLDWHVCRRPFFPLDDSVTPLFRTA